MANTIKQFSYKLHKMNKNSRLPFDPILILNLNHWSRGDDDIPQISPHLVSEREIDEHIQALKDDLDAVGKRAKAAFKKAKAATHKIVSERNAN